MHGMLELADIGMGSTYISPTESSNRRFTVLRWEVEPSEGESLCGSGQYVGYAHPCCWQSQAGLAAGFSSDIFKFCLSLAFPLAPQWLPHAQNACAHLLSRFPDRDNWSLNPADFRWFDAEGHAYSVDHFSSHYNSHVARFKRWGPLLFQLAFHFFLAFPA